MEEQFDEFPVNILEMDGKIEREGFNFNYHNFLVYRAGKCIYSSNNEGTLKAFIVGGKLLVEIEDTETTNFMKSTFTLKQISTNLDRIIWSKNLTDPEEDSVRNEPDVLSLFYHNSELKRASFVINNPSTHIEFNKEENSEFNEDDFQEDEFDSEEFEEDEIEDDEEDETEHPLSLTGFFREDVPLSFYAKHLCTSAIKDKELDITYKNKNILILCREIYDAFDNDKFDIDDEFKNDEHRLVFWSSSRKYKFIISRYNLPFLKYNVTLETYENGKFVSTNAPYYEQHINISSKDAINHFNNHIIKKI